MTAAVSMSRFIVIFHLFYNFFWAQLAAMLVLVACWVKPTGWYFTCLSSNWDFVDPKNIFLIDKHHVYLVAQLKPHQKPPGHIEAQLFLSPQTRLSERDVTCFVEMLVWCEWHLEIWSYPWFAKKTTFYSGNHITHRPIWVWLCSWCWDVDLRWLVLPLHNYSNDDIR